MSALRGSLRRLELIPLLRLFAQVSASGRLELWNGEFVGIIYLEMGHVIGAIFGADSGLAALDAIFLALSEAEFSFSDRPREPARNITSDMDEVLQRLDSLAKQSASLALPGLNCVPRLLPLDKHDGGGRLTPDSPLRPLLREINGSRTVADLLRGGGAAQTLIGLTQLAALQLISIEPLRCDPAPRRDSGLVHRLRRLIAGPLEGPGP
jgi:hypothetical protein